MKRLLILTATALCMSHALAAAELFSVCPKPTDAKKNTDPSVLNWTAETPQGKWKSYDTSFATKLTKFVGAQWTGENVGQITCVYNSEQKFMMEGKPQVQPTIPVLLVYHALAFQPSGAKWQHKGHGLYNCYSFSRKDCPFKINMKPKTGNIYQQAESLKLKAKPALQNPSY